MDTFWLIYSQLKLGDVHVVHGDSGDVTGEHAHRHDGDDVPDHRREKERVDETGR